MARLTSAERNALPSSAFADPKDRKYPINDPSHAANAKARASEMAGKGRISAGMKNKIDAKADKKLGTNVRNAATHAMKLKHIAILLALAIASLFAGRAEAGANPPECGNNCPFAK